MCLAVAKGRCAVRDSCGSCGRIIRYEWGQGKYIMFFNLCVPLPGKKFNACTYTVQVQWALIRKIERIKEKRKQILRKSWFPIIIIIIIYMLYYMKVFQQASIVCVLKRDWNVIYSSVLWQPPFVPYFGLNFQNKYISLYFIPLNYYRSDV